MSDKHQNGAAPHTPNNTPPCNWAGEHSGPPALTVDIARPCGHIEALALPVCAKHLDHLIKASAAPHGTAPCIVCGETKPARLIAAHELHEPAAIN